MGVSSDDICEVIFQRNGKRIIIEKIKAVVKGQIDSWEERLKWYRVKYGDEYNTQKEEEILCFFKEMKFVRYIDDIDVPIHNVKCGNCRGLSLNFWIDDSSLCPKCKDGEIFAAEQVIY